MTVSNLKLTDLPPALQSHILSMLLPTPISLRSVKPSLEHVTSLRRQLPHDLLSAAKTCCSLSQAAIDALGPRVQLLNKATADPLWAWVAQFRSVVRAVSLQAFEEDSMRSLLPFMQPDILTETCDHAVKTFVALSMEHVHLEVLDVKSVPFHKYSHPSLLQETLLNTLERNKSTLRELGLRITPVCINAVSRVTLPKLHTVEIMLSEVGGRDEIITADKGQCAHACMQMLHALEGHADRIANKTTLHELRLKSFSEAPCTNDDMACTGLFQSVQVLNLRSIAYNRRNDGDIAKFVALFPNLRRLHWNGAAAAEGFHHIHSRCPALEELHLRPYIRYTPTGDMLEAGEDPVAVNELLASYKKLRSLEIQAALSPEQLRILGENNPAIEHLSMEIDTDNVGALSLLLGTHCRQIRTLKLSFIPHSVVGLGEVGWHQLAEGIQSASEELCELSIMGHLDRYPREAAHDAMVQSVLDIIEFLGERVRRFCLTVPFETSELEVIYEALCTIMNACATHSANLERLSVRVERTDIIRGFENGEEETNWSVKLLTEFVNLLKLPHLHFLDLAERDVRAQEAISYDGS